MSETIADIAAKSRSVDDFIDTICHRVKIRKPSKSSYWAVVVECVYNEIRRLACRNQPGDAAAMREAVGRAIRMVEDCVNNSGESALFYATCLLSVNDILRPALSAQPRQCDVGTAEEQNERYKLYCADHRDTDGGPGAHCMKCPLNDRKNSLVMCQFLWAQMTYEKGGAK